MRHRAENDLEQFLLDIQECVGIKSSIDEIIKDTLGDKCVHLSELKRKLKQKFSVIREETIYPDDDLSQTGRNLRFVIKSVYGVSQIVLKINVTLAPLPLNIDPGVRSL